MKLSEIVIDKNRVKKLINDAAKKLDALDKHKKKVTLAAFLLFVAIVFLFSWTADDAFHSYVMARNFAEGKGLVYNAGYRVNATTSPLITVLQGCLYFIAGDMLFVGIAIGMVFMTGAAYLIFFRFCKTAAQTIFAFLAMLLNYCFMCFTSSALENPLLFFFGVLFFYIASKKEQFGKVDLFLLALLMSVIALTRMDNVLFYIPLIVYIYLFRTKVFFPARVLIGLAGLMPFVLWEAFSLIYYGFLFPNTYYFKENTGYPQSDYTIAGLDYIGRSCIADPMFVVLTAALIVLVVRHRDKKGILLTSGILLYTVYVVHIGGDFMLGRHLTVQYILSLAGVLYLKNAYAEDAVLVGKLHIKKAAAVWLAVCFLWASFGSPFYRYYQRLPYTYIADERIYFTEIGDTRTLSLIARSFSRSEPLSEDSLPKMKELMRNSLDNGLEGYICDTGKLIYGYDIYYLKGYKDIAVIDGYGVMDPLLSQLPAVHIKLHIGHFQRVMPEGYRESIEQGKNLIKDQSLHEYYDKLLLIISGDDLFAPERLEAIGDMMTGKYKHLIDEYVAAHPECVTG